MSALDTQVGGNHYRNGGIQPVQYIEANKLLFLEASVVKRVTRHDKDGGKGRQDIEKAIHELQLLLELRYPLVGVQMPTSDRCLRCQKYHLGLCADKITAKDCKVCGAVNGHGGLPCPHTSPMG